MSPRKSKATQSALARAPSPDKIRKALLESARAAGAVLLKYQGKRLRIREKLGAGLVTQADTQAERAALKVLMNAFPDFGYLSEESPAHLSRGLGRFVLDPLDGTTNFVHGFPMFCVSVAAEWAGEIIGGVIVHPVLGDEYVGIRGKGAYLNGKRMHVSNTHRLRDSLLSTGFTYGKEDWLRAEMLSFERLSGTARAVRRPGSAALDLAYVARGVFDGFWERRLSPWDVAAGSLLIEEAGGCVSNYRGERFRLGDPEILASNKRLHAELRMGVAPEFCPLPTS